MKMEMPRPVAGRQRNGGRVVRRQHPFLCIELPDEDFVQPEVRMQDETSRSVGLDHVSVGPIVSADSEAARWSARRFGWADLAGIVLNVGGVAQAAVRKDRQHRDG